MRNEEQLDLDKRAQVPAFLMRAADTSGNIKEVNP